MPKRKFDDDQAVDQTVPLPIQTFLWRQTSPFIRPKLGKLCEASCVSFERVLVQNILHGLSPSLCDSIQSISRWRLIQASFPHVMHCCAAVLGNRKQNFPDTKFGISETKLLYTLHWIILDAASECDDADSALPGYQKPATLPLHSLSAIQLFVYLFAPLVQSLKESDFQSLKLENGLRLWQPLWDYHQPDIPCFATPVRPKRNVLKAQRSLLKLNTNAANIYIGKGSSTDNIYLGPEPVVMSRGSVVESSSPLAPLARMSDICGTISDTQSVQMEVVCEVCNTVLYGTAGQNGSCCKCGRKDSLILMPDSKIANMPNLQKLTSPLQNLDKDFIKKRIETAIAQSAAAQGPPNPDILSASYFDVAVLRCLFSPSWVEDGVYWSLRYIHQRLLEVSDDLVRQEFTRERSKSLPVPEITVSVYRAAPPSPPMRPDSEDDISLPDRDTGCYINRSSYSIGPPPSPTPNKDYPHKRIRSVRQLFESKTKLARIESIDQDEIETRMKQSQLNHSSEDMQIEMKDLDGEKDKDKDYMTVESAEEGTPPPRPSSAMGRYRDPGNESMDEEDEDDDDQSGSFSDLVRRRSMPVITQCGTDSESAVSLTPIASPQNKKDPVSRTMSLKPEMLTKPIITITEDSPSPSPTPSDWSRKRESIASEKFEHANRPGLHRSFTDTNISYLCEEEVEEVGGSVHYIDSKGHINCRVVLKAVHFVAMNDLSARSSDVMLNILNVLMDLEVIEKKGDSKKEQLKKMAESCGDELPDSAKMAAEKKEEEMTLHNMAMDTVIRIFKALGCPHGCGDGFRGPLGEHVRSHGLNCLQRLQRFNSTQFRKYLREFIRKRPVQEVVDFLHAFLGFCADSGVPNATYSPPAQKKNAGDNTNRSGFAINFGHSIGGAGKGIEGQVIAHILKPMVSRFVDSKKDLAGHENISLYCDVRQMVNFIKEQHGGTFRRVALSGLLDSANRPAKKRDKGKGHSAAVRRTMSVTSESGDEREPGKSTSTGNVDEVGNSQGKSRRSIFRRRTKKNASSSNILSAASDSEMNDNEFGRHHIKLSPRMSMSAAEDDPPSGPSTPKRKFSKFNIGGGHKQRNKHGLERHSDHGRHTSSGGEENLSGGVPDKKNNGKKQVKAHVPVYGRSLSHNYPLVGHGRGSGHGHGWRRSAKSDHEDDSTTDLTQFAENRRESVHQRGKRMSFKAAGQATLTFLTARKRLEDSLKSFGKKRLSKRGSIDDDLVRRGSLEVGNSHQAEVIIFKEKKLVDAWAVKSGMLRFSFFMDCVQPGSVPDPQLVAAMLDLEAPVVARGALLLECSHFVHRCNRGDWPNWMRLNLPSFRMGGPLQSRGQPSGYKRNTLLQRTAGRMFYMWAEALGLKLEQILMQEHKDKFDHIHQVKDDNRKKELREADDDEDFMDEATVNHTGSDCPHALKMVACQLLLEITTFLRETYQYIPKIKASKREHPMEKATQRWSTVLSSPVHSDRSSASFTDQPYGSPGDRKISFAVLGEQRERSDSLHSSTTTISAAAGDPDDKKEKRVAQGRKLLKMRRNSGQNSSFKNRSFKMKREPGGSLKRMGSMRSRKVSVQSIKSEKSDEEITAPPQHNSLDVESPDEMAESPEYDTEDNLCTHMPWLRVIIQLANTSNFICDHQNFCHPNCYERQQRSCTRLMNATFKVYDCEEPENVDEDGRKLDDSKKDTFREKLKRRESVFQPSSPIRRRESTPLLDKIRSDVNLAKLMKIDANRDKKETNPKPKKKEDTNMVKYLKSQVQKLCHSPMALMSKAAPVLQDDNLVDILPVAWELLMENDQELASAAASVFILSAIKVPEQVQEMMTKELQHEDTNQRINAVLRYSILWRFRYQMWPRMEEGANMFFKVPPPSIDFVLPSPTIGNPTQTIVDPPWMPHFKTKVEEVTLSQEGSKSLVTATTTRRKQQQEMIHQALIAEEDRKREAREKFLINTINASQLAANEPALHHSTDEHEEDEEQVERAHTHPMQLAQPTFPSCICAAVLPIIHLLDDLEVNQDGISVSEVAEKIIWWCLVEDPPLFFRHFLEKLTKKESQDELFFVLRRLMIRMPTLPAQTAHTIFNYIIGFVMFYVRSPCEGSQEAIGGALSMLWMIVPSVQGIYFKDLKQTLRKEQCDPTLLVTANVPSAKKVVVHGTDLTSIPSQFPIHEDTQFSMILEDSIDFFNIPDNEKNSCFLVDTKSNQMHNLNSYVRDLYFFRRNFYPQLSLVMMDPQDAFNTLQKQAFTQKFVEIGKVMFATEVLQSTAPHQMQTHVNFLHEELTKLPSFPRKALEAEFNLYKGDMGKELYGLDMLHKFAWARMVNSLFHSMTSTFNWMGDIPLFLNVINGTFLLHCDDIAMLRFCLSSYISTSRHFKHVFATNGFMYVIPTVVRVYANHQNNPVLCQAIEFTCKQFYILHRKPFILQMFGSLAPILDSDENSDLIDCNKVPPKCLFNLLMSLESQSRDNLLILDMVQGDMPLKALDFCYEMDPDTFSMIDAINVCVAVVAYASDSYRGMQMLTILEAIVPFYLRKMKTETNKLQTPIAARQEINTISNMAVSMRALINSCEALTRNISGPQRHIENVNTNVNKPCANHSSAVYYDDREDSVFKYMEEGRHNQYNYAAHDEDDEIRSEYRKPRDSLLNITAEFFATCLPRLKELRKMLADPSFKFPELLDYKAHLRLADIAHTLLKIAPYDPLVMGSRGLQRYITEILPITDWSIEAVRPALNLILRRLDRLFNKIYKKTSLRRHLNWDCAANLLKGVYLTLTKYQYIAHLPHLKTVINMCLNIILSDVGSSSMYDSLHNVHYGNRNEQVNHHLAAPPRFCSAVVKLMATQMQCLGEQFSVEHICGGMSVFPSPEKTQNMLVNLILPLCIRVGCGRRDAPKVRPADISFILTVVLNAILPPTHMPQNPKNQLLSVGEIGRLGSSSGSDRSSNKVVRDAVMQTAFLGLKIIMVCFQNKLSSEWHRIAKCVQEMTSVTGRHAGGVYMWQFIDFVVTIRPPLFVILYPFIQYKLMKLTCESEHEYYLQQLIGQRLKGHLLPAPKSSGSTLIELANELRGIKDDMTIRGPGDDIRPRTNTNETTTRIDIPKENSSQNARPRHLPRPSIADLMDPSFGVRVLPLPTEKRSSKGAGLSPITPGPYVPPSQTAPPPPDPVEEEKIEGTQVSGVEAAPDEDEPHLLLRRHSSRRITAEEGNKILEKYSKPETQTEAEFLESLPPKPHDERLEEEQPIGSASPDMAGYDPRSHRLQRADAKSRKTFKIKRAKTSIRKQPATRTVSAGFGIRAEEMLQPAQEEQDSLASKKAAKRHYIPKSKSNEDGPFETHHAAGTARARIARQGGRMIRSRSPSTSPVRHARSPATSPTRERQQVPGQQQTYMSRTDSVESITTSENSALLKQDEKTKSQSSLCIYFDANDVQDTCV